VEKGSLAILYVLHTNKKFSLLKGSWGNQWSAYGIAVEKPFWNLYF